MRGVLQQNLEQICDLEQQYFEGKMTRMNNLFVIWTNSLCPMLGFNGTKPWAICNLGQHFEGEATKNEQFISYEQNSWCSMWGWVKWDKTLSNLWSSLLLGWLWIGLQHPTTLALTITHQQKQHCCIFQSAEQTQNNVGKHPLQGKTSITHIHPSTDSRCTSRGSK